MNRYFKTTEVVYEGIRNRMDLASGYPSNEAETWFTPVSEAPKAPDGEVLIACIEPIAEEFVVEGCVELTKNEYKQLLLRPETE